jgi:hypothetical protein
MAFLMRAQRYPSFLNASTLLICIGFVFDTCVLAVLHVMLEVVTVRNVFDERYRRGQWL